MTLFAYLNGSDIGYKVRLNGFGLSSRADGSAGFGGIVFDDAAGNLTVRGWMSVIVRENACTTAPVLFTGYVADRTYARNGDTEYRTTTARWIDTNLVDANAVLHIRLITGEDGKRPAETHNERIDWLMNSAYLSGLIADDSLVDTSNPRPFEDADYRGQYPDDVLNDISAPIFRIFFVYPDPLTGSRTLFFDTPTSTVGTSTLTLSNVLSDITRDATGVITGTCYPPSLDATMTRDPSEVYAKVRYTYAHGTVIENSSDTRDQFFLDNGLGYRGLQVDNTRIGVEDSARDMADGILERDSTENDTITVTVQLPAAKAGLIRAGQRLGVRFSHLPGYETLTYTRVTGLTIRQAPGTEALYDLQLELNAHGSSGGGGGGAPGPGTLPTPPPGVAAHWWTFAYTLIGDVTSWPGGINGHSSDTRHFIGGVGASYTYEITIATQAHPGTYAPTIEIINAGGSNFKTILSLPSHGEGQTTTYTGTFDDSLPTANPIATDDYYMSGGVADGDHSMTHTATVSGWIDPAGWDAGGGSVAPIPGQPVLGEVVTMTDNAGVTANGYADGSLKIRLNGVPVTTASYTETDPACGLFVLSWTPYADDVITVDYQGR